MSDFYSGMLSAMAVSAKDGFDASVGLGSHEAQGDLFAPAAVEEKLAVHYQLVLDGNECLDLVSCLGKTLKIEFLEKISCIHCGRFIQKTYSGGYCFPCSQSLAQCDLCIMRPHTCHYEQGTCRDDQFAQSQCFQPHTLYLARSDVLKVGITRQKRQLTRWMEQGAVEARVIGVFESRKEVGLAEHAISQIMSDRANWRKMLKNELSEASLEQALEQARAVLSEHQQGFLIENGQEFHFEYPVQSYPQKPKSLKLDQNPQIEAKLTGIKGQYLIFDDQVFNVRAHSAYHIRVSVLSA